MLHESLCGTLSKGGAGNTFSGERAVNETAFYYAVQKVNIKINFSIKE